MKVVKKGSDDERRILLGMILSDEVAGRIAEKMNDEQEPFRSRWANLIAGWVKDFYQRYEKAPAQAIEGLFRQWAEVNQSEEKTISLVERFLEALDAEADSYDINSKFTIDLAGQLFNKVRLERHVEVLQGEMDSGRVSKAISRAEEFRRLEIGEGEGVDVFQDKEAVRAAFSEESEVLVTYPGPLGHFFGDRLKRDSLISFMAPEKRGKSWWLVDLSWRAMNQRRKVAFFAVGDMGQDEMIQRLMIRSAKHPEKPCIVEVPKRIESEGEGKPPTIDHVPKKFSTGLNWQRAWLSCKKTMTQRVRSKESYFRLSVILPIQSASMASRRSSKGGIGTGGFLTSS
jgi:hypothetical protein